LDLVLMQRYMDLLYLCEPTSRNQASHNSSNLKSMRLIEANWVRRPGSSERDPTCRVEESRF
jgi:hypothetical protein